MKSERVTRTWEFYRDNCPGFKEPMRKEFRKLDGYVSSIEDENARLRELVRHMGACIQYLDRTDEDGGCVHCPYQTVEYDCGFEQRMNELGIEVEP